jgi:DNA mismatch repair endonuclease MutH
MERQQALNLLQQLKGKDLRVLADEYEVTVFKNGKKNKGWAGHVIEHYLGLPINSAQSPNFGSWELKTISLKTLINGKLTVKETMAITMIDPYNVKNTPFEESHLLAKMKKILILSRIWEGQNEPSSVVYGVHTFDIGNEEIYNQIKEDYDLVRETIKNQGFEALTGRMGVFIQPRTKGAGHGSTSRAFYARVPFLKKIILIND